jgi:hypothetical protein
VKKSKCPHSQLFGPVRQHPEVDPPLPLRPNKKKPYK